MIDKQQICKIAHFNKTHLVIVIAEVGGVLRPHNQYLTRHYAAFLAKVSPVVISRRVTAQYTPLMGTGDTTEHAAAEDAVFEHQTCALTPLHG